MYEVWLTRNLCLLSKRTSPVEWLTDTELGSISEPSACQASDREVCRAVQWIYQDVMGMAIVTSALRTLRLTSLKV